jgi:hypothetical protein
MDGTRSTIEEMRNASKILVGKHHGKRSLGRHTRRWKDNIKIYLRETGRDGGN